MENVFPTSSTNSGSTTNTTNASSVMTGSPQNSQVPIYGPSSYPSTLSSLLTQPNYTTPPCETTEFPPTYSLEQRSQYTPSADPFYPVMVGPNAIEMQRPCILQPNALQLEHERRALDANKTKVARCARKLARQRRLGKASSGASSARIKDASRLALHGANIDSQNSRTNTSKDLYEFLTPDNKKLRALLRKDLKNSDVGSLGRIVLPKREVEENLPPLHDKEGILLVLRDVNSNQEWGLKLKFWANNKSRMYVLENTGEFVKRSGLETGDSLTLYEDESKNLYFSITKAQTPASPLTQTPHPMSQNDNYLYTEHTWLDRDEEYSSLALLTEQLENEEQEEANSLGAVPMDFSCSYTLEPELNNIRTFTQPASAAMQTSPPNGKMKAVDDSHDADDCYTGLGMLPDVHSYNFSP
ncbi:hypothetical protein SADUNF_Sadunf11G0033400 [Salix dunnii]|uniref:TF-B3 domain-containing protein n=1 Tax=Salix dunnii TaxID=1413687 RepID=A0A835JPU7_9ROSI|nr:hypothetical protein SADUNF_Sadunf11G0033400 [Salix dunnii]